MDPKTIKPPLLQEAGGRSWNEDGLYISHNGATPCRTEASDRVQSILRVSRLEEGKHYNISGPTGKPAPTSDFGWPCVRDYTGPDYKPPATATQPPKQKRLTVGTKVRRGPDWKWGDQDGDRRPGVVTDVGPDGWVMVRWGDQGVASNCYRWGLGDWEGDVYDLEVVSLPEPAAKATSPKVPPPAVGTKVCVSRTWKEGDFGIHGLTHMDHGVVTSAERDLVSVRWLTGRSVGLTFAHRWGHNGVYDIAFLYEAGLRTEPEAPTYAHHGAQIEVKVSVDPMPPLPVAEIFKTRWTWTPKDESGPSASAGPDMVPAAVLLRRASRGNPGRKIVVPTEGFWDMDHLLPDAEPEGIVPRRAK